MAWAYATAFYAEEYDIQCIISRNLKNAEAIANQVRAEAYSEYKWIEHSDIIILCVQDDAITEVADAIKPYIQKQLIVHSSGANSKSLLADFERHGVLWPLQTITKGEAVDWTNTPLIYDANEPEAAQILRHLSASISNRNEMRNDAERQIMHIAAVWANNFTNHMFTEAKEVLDVADLPFDLLIPIIKETVQKVQNLPPGETQTGPASRNDTKTINKHINFLLKLNASKSELYKHISDRIRAKT